MIVRDIMTEDPVTIDSAAPLEDIIEVLLDHDIRHLPVVEDDVLVGMISDRDVRAHTLPTLVAFEHPVESADLLYTNAASVMHPDVLTVTAEADVKAVIEIMIDQRIGAVAVTDPDTYALVGIVSYIDVLRAAQAYL